MRRTEGERERVRERGRAERGRVSKRGGRGNATQFEQSVFSVNAECSRLNTRSHTRSHVHVQFTHTFTHTFTHVHARSHTFNVRERVRTCMNEHERAEQARGTAHLPGLAATTRRVHFRGRLPQTPAACFRTPTQTRPEKHVPPRRRARRRAPDASVHTRSAASWTLAALQRGRRGAYTGRAGGPHLTAWTVRAARCSAATAAAPTLAGLLLARGFRTPTQLMMTGGLYSTVEVCPKFPGQRFDRCEI